MKIPIKKIFLIISALLISAGCNHKILVSPQPFAPAANYTHNLRVGTQTLAVEIVNTPEKMEQGLSGRDAMADDQGMLFDFKTSTSTTENFGAAPSFWMKDMKFNLDLIWIKSGHVIGITPDVPAPIENFKLKIENSSLPLYSPPSPVDEVLEVNAGWSSSHKIKTGDEVRIIN